MAWTTPTVVGSGSTSGNTQSSTAQTSASVSFVNGKSYICSIASCDPDFTAHTHGTPTGGITWTEAENLVPGGSSGDSRFSVWVGTCTGNTSAVVQSTLSTSALWRIQVEEWDAFTVRNSDVDAGSWMDASAAITLPAFADAESAGWSGWMGLVTDSAVTPDTSWTELAENTFNDWSGGAQGRLETQYRLDTTDNTAAASVTSCWYLLGAAMELVHAAVTREQEGFQFRLDDGSESGATDVGAQDANMTAPTGVNRRLRVLTNATGDAPSEALRLEYRYVGDTDWETVN